MAGPLDELMAAQTSANPSAFLSPSSQPAPLTVAKPASAFWQPGVPPINPSGSPLSPGSANPGGGSRQAPTDPATAAIPMSPFIPGSMAGQPGFQALSDDDEAYAVKGAIARGIDPRKALLTANSEGGFGRFLIGDQGSSGGSFQFHLDDPKNPGKGNSMGDQFFRETGKNPLDPANNRAMIDYALDYAKAHGGAFDPNIWHGLRASATVPGFSLADRAAAVKKVQEDKYAEAAGLNKTADAAIKAIGTMQGDLGKVMERVREAQGKADQANDAALASISKAPSQPDINGFKQLNGLAVLVGVLGGIFTKSPMRSSINAAAAAIEGYNDHDREAYETSYRNWKTQTDLLFKISDMTQNRVKDILYAENMGFNERNALLDTTLRAAGLTDLANQRKTQGDEILTKWMEDTEAARVKQRELEQKEKDAHEWRMFQVSNPRNEMEWINQRINEEDKENVAQGLPPYTAAEKIQRGEAIKKAMNEGRRAASSTPHPIIATMPDGKTWQGEATYDPTTKTYAGIGRSEPFPQGTTFKPAPASLGVNAININQRILMGATDLDLQLKNWTSLPMGTTLGLFSGAQAHTPDGLVDAMRRNLANAATPEAAQYAAVLSNGLGRALGSLMAGGAATGLVGLSKQLQNDVPQANDSVGTILFKLADMKQIGVNAIEVVHANPLVGDEQRALLDKINTSLNESVPFTPQQVIKMTHGDEQSMREFVKSLPELSSGADAAAHPPQIQNGWRYEWKDGGYKPVAAVQ